MKKSKKKKVPNPTQTATRQRRIKLIEELIQAGITTNIEIYSYIRKSVEKDENSGFNFKVSHPTLLNYVETAKTNVAMGYKPDYFLLSGFVNKELMETVIKAKAMGDDKTKMDALDRMVKLNALDNVDIKKQLVYADLLEKKDIDDDKNLDTLSEKEIREKRKERNSRNEKRKI